LSQAIVMLSGFTCVAHLYSITLCSHLLNKIIGDTIPANQFITPTITS
jgi:hypothetical protein